MIMKIPCLFIRPLVERFVDEELSAGSEKMIRNHLARCSRCKEEVKLLFALRKAVQLLPAPVQEERFWNDLWQGVLAKLTTLTRVRTIPFSTGFFYRNRLALAGAVAALAILVAAAGILTLGTGEQSQRSIVPYIDYHVSQTDQRVLLENQLWGSQYMLVSYHGQ